MGALHEGHRALMRRARRLGDVVVVSIYVNPTQFGRGEDFKRYPRQMSADIDICREEGVDAVFAPRNLYAADASTWVEETKLSVDRCGAVRPGHFRGVATVVAKLFNICQPQHAVFGLKDFQQCQVLERMVRDLNFAVRLDFVPTVREEDGLAMSSRNSYLSAEERAAAAAFPRILREAASGGWSDEATATALRMAGFSVDYVTTSGGRLCAAVRVGTTRLIDNFARRAVRMRREQG
jgi:pantoate--beta-alanine ligase